MTLTTSGSTQYPPQTGDVNDGGNPKPKLVKGPVPTSEGGHQPAPHSEMKSKAKGGRK